MTEIKFFKLYKKSIKISVTGSVVELFKPNLMFHVTASEDMKLVK